MAPNFDNNQAYKAMKGKAYSAAMLRAFQRELGFTENDRNDLRALATICCTIPYLHEAGIAAEDFHKS